MANVNSGDVSTAGIAPIPVAASESVTDNLDYSGEDAKTGQIPEPHAGANYDPRPQEDDARRRIAYLLIGLLCFTVIGIFVLLGFGAIAVGDLKEFGVVLSPIIALVSAATGFYYGTKSNHGTGS